MSFRASARNLSSYLLGTIKNSHIGRNDNRAIFFLGEGDCRKLKNIKNIPPVFGFNFLTLISLYHVWRA